jgi:hypothetical protein
MSEYIAEIKRGLSLLFKPGDAFEVRVPRKKGTEFSTNISGFFNDIESAAVAIDYANEQKNTVYVTMNPVAPSWMAINNKIYLGSKAMRDEIESAQQSYEPRMKQSTFWESGKTSWSMRMAEDADIRKRRWILIDIDAGQPADTNSTDEEHKNTLAMAKAVISFLEERGFPAPALTNSGNGHHVLVRVDLENTVQSTILVRRFLKSLIQRFNKRFGLASIDESVFNAARITKAYGTLVFKGVPSTERPCRQSYVLSTGSNKIALAEQLTEIAEEYVMQPGENFASWDGETVSISDTELQKELERVQDFLDFYEIEYRNVREVDSDLILPCVCPNSAEHTMDGGDMECVVMVSASGAKSFCCQHAHCNHLRTWRGMRKHMEETTGRVFEWEPAGQLLLKGKPLSKDSSDQKSIVVDPPEPSQRMKAIAFLQSLTLPCRVVDAVEQAAKLGVTPKALQRSYAAAEIDAVQRPGGDWVLESF